MYTTVNPEGQLNNYAVEPEMYLATYPSQSQQFRYLQQGALSLLLVTTMMFIAWGVS
ncbi:MAG: ssl1498 family light-harvesting-like protein [Spirulina sp. SIO3F2]|nr:ssl1498 family light-harvesting-like protein [Spirulina sp. SIO3F2]